MKSKKKEEAREGNVSRQASSEVTEGKDGHVRIGEMMLKPTTHPLTILR